MSQQFIEQISLLRGRFINTINEATLTGIIIQNMKQRIREQLTTLDVTELVLLSTKATRLEALFRDRDMEAPKKGNHVANQMALDPYSMPDYVTP